MDKKYLSVIVFLVVLILVGVILISTKKNKTSAIDLSSQNIIPSATIDSTVQDVTELIITDEKVGTGNEATPGKKVTVNYIGTLTDGTKFDSSYDRNEPFSFNLGAGEVIPGWDQGVAGMKVGGKRKLTIPASLGYGPQTVGSIPANSTLIFEVELLKVE